MAKPLDESVELALVKGGSSEPELQDEPLQTWERALPWIVFGLSALILGWGAAPGVTFHDSGEFALAAKTGGLPHPPGAPTWTLTAWIATSLLRFLDAAYVTNLLSAAYGAGALGFATWISQTWIRKSFSDTPRSVIALAAPLVLLGSSAFLEQAFVTEQYTLLLLFNMAILALSTKGWIDGSLSWKGWIGLGLMFGLACGNHPSQIVLGPLMIVLAATIGEKKGFLARFGLGLAGSLAGLSIFLYNPIRASTHPIINWGQPDTWDRFFWGITRQQWPSRPFDHAPVGFVEEWMRSFSLPAQVGWAAIIFAVLGLVVMIRRAPKPLLWLLLLVVPYAAVLLLGHLKQDGMDNIYVRFYGVIDWHLPVYALFALGAAYGIAQVADMFQTRGREVMAGAAVLLLGALAGAAYVHESLHDSTDTELYVENSLAAIPQDALLFLASDNSSHPLAYAQWAQKRRPDVFFGYGYPQYQGAQGNTFVWGPRWRHKWLTEGMHNFKFQPLDLPKLAEKDFNRPLFVEYPPKMPAAAAFMLPAGWLWELKDKPVTGDEVKAADAKWMASNPELFAQPAPGSQVHRLTREAFSQVHQRRGNYFTARQMYGSAVASYKLALAWQPENPQIWFGLGFAYQMSGAKTDAWDCYAKANELMPDHPGPSGALGLLALELGKKEEAKALMIKEVEVNPRDEAAIANLRRVMGDEQNSKATP